MDKAYFRGNETYYPFTFPIGMWPKKWVDRDPDKVVLVDVDHGKQCTTRDIHVNSNILANALLARGMKKGDVLAVILPNCVEFMYIYFACAKTGIIFMPLNFHLTPRELEYEVKLVEPSMVIIEEEFVNNVSNLLKTGVSFKKEDVYCLKLTDSKKALPFQDYKILFNKANDMDPELDWKIDTEDVQIVMFTSGTTGRAKGCMFSYRKTFYNTINDVLRNDDRAEDKFLLNLPLFHSYGLNIITIPALYAGATVYMMGGMDAEKLCQLIEKEQISKWLTITLIGRLLVASDLEEKYRLSSMKLFFMGGEPVPAHIVKSLKSKWSHIAFTAGLGTTETSLCLVLAPAYAESKAGSAGKALFYSNIRVVDKNNNDMKPGEVGELLIGGPVVFSGYWNNPEATREAIDAGGYFHSGDLVKRDEDGFVYVVDREKEVIISGGENIYPAEVDEVISQHPAVAEVATIGIPDPKWGERPIAVVVPRNAKTVTTEEIRAFCAGKLAKFKIPDRVEITDSLPHTGPGKVARWQLREKYGGGIAR